MAIYALLFRICKTTFFFCFNKLYQLLQLIKWHFENNVKAIFLFFLEQINFEEWIHQPEETKPQAGNV